MQRLTDHREASCENQAKRERSCGGWNSDARDRHGTPVFPCQLGGDIPLMPTAAHCCPLMPTCNMRLLHNNFPFDTRPADFGPRPRRPNRRRALEAERG